MKYKDDFDHEEFYSWCYEKSLEGHTIFISEYSMPTPFVCLWEKKLNSSLTLDTGAKVGLERLFTLTYPRD